MTTGEISGDEFARRLVDLCLQGAGGLPRRQRDLHILLASSTLWMDDAAVYAEGEINAGLSQWLESVCPALRLDFVTLRRELIDSSYLLRDDSGHHYTTGPGSPAFRFSAEIATVDAEAVIGEARAEREARRQAHTSRG